MSLASSVPNPFGAVATPAAPWFVNHGFAPEEPKTFSQSRARRETTNIKGGDPQIMETPFGCPPRPIPKGTPRYTFDPRNCGLHSPEWQWVLFPPVNITEPPFALVSVPWQPDGECGVAKPQHGGTDTHFMKEIPELCPNWRKVCGGDPPPDLPANLHRCKVPDHFRWTRIVNTSSNESEWIVAATGSEVCTAKNPEDAHTRATLMRARKRPNIFSAKEICSSVGHVQPLKWNVYSEHFPPCRAAKGYQYTRVRDRTGGKFWVTRPWWQFYDDPIKTPLAECTVFPRDPNYYVDEIPWSCYKWCAAKDSYKTSRTPDEVQELDEIASPDGVTPTEKHSAAVGANTEVSASPEGNSSHSDMGYEGIPTRMETVNASASPRRNSSHAQTGDQGISTGAEIDNLTSNPRRDLSQAGVLRELTPFRGNLTDAATVKRENKTRNPGHKNRMKHHGGGCDCRRIRKRLEREVRFWRKKTEMQCHRMSTIVT